jgi:hypothetical protein
MKPAPARTQASPTPEAQPGPAASTDPGPEGPEGPEDPEGPVSPDGPAEAGRRGSRTSPARLSPPARPFFVASVLGGVVGLVVFVALLSRGFKSLTAPVFSTNFYDLQARAFLDGRMWIPNGSASLEGIVFRGHTYIYFGPFLALIRLPVAALAPGTAGHLAQASMVVAAVVLISGSTWLGWNIRHVLRGSAPLTRFDLVAQSAFSASLAGGSVVLYLAGSPSIYYETALWGAVLHPAYSRFGGPAVPRRAL